MSILHKILAASHLPLKFSNSIAKFLKIKVNSDLRVLLYHDIPLDKQELFLAQLQELSKVWKFVSPEEFEEMILGNKEIVGKNLLLSFDDGYISNRRVTEEVLEKMGIKALFFIISDFVSISNYEDSKTFVSANVYPDYTPEQVPDSWLPMNWNDLKFLLEKGHSIGSHTKTHARLSKIENLDQLKDEIINSKQILENKLGITIKHFAYTFGDLGSFSEIALSIAKTNYEFVHTGLRGNNFKTYPWAIRREATSPEDSLQLISAFLEGGADVLYKKKLQIYESWGLN
ncbi:polysaccharide deacetylase family protein [Leptospira limi]|uniref:Polysaccharide deacetylase family protein n=1 Tax=Leptospira limi TaxID=2950023 RepID=A0ABT3LZ05_9LEPT|nr:polysaccharide deacetylase family protein [Leptospira limi]MCW7462952.1 polysaccharide deacetylase family protein [Leptospira limi]